MELEKLERACGGPRPGEWGGGVGRGGHAHLSCSRALFMVEARSIIMPLALGIPLRPHHVPTVVELGAPLPGRPL